MHTSFVWNIDWPSEASSGWRSLGPGAVLKSTRKSGCAARDINTPVDRDEREEEREKGRKEERERIISGYEILQLG